MKCAFGENPTTLYDQPHVHPYDQCSFDPGSTAESCIIHGKKKRPPVMTSPSCLLLIKNQNP